MIKADQINRDTQHRIVELFIGKLGYTYLGNWEELENCSNIEERHLSHYLTQQGYNTIQISKAMYELKQVINSFSDDLYQKNKKVYALLRNGLCLKEDAITPNTTIKLIDWNNWSNNDFGIAQEVSIRGNKHKRPDLVLYVNGIALAVLELKKGAEDISEGIRQCVTMQQGHFVESFFSTIQLIIAGNDQQGLRYGTVKTEEKSYLKWVEESEGCEASAQLEIDQHLIRLCNKERLLEMVYGGLVFDGGKKKVAAPQHYFALKAAKERIQHKEGGIIWHNQGNKSGMMVLLAKWILENNDNARVIILTDNPELDKQLETLFTENGESIKRTANSKKLLQQLHQPSPKILCSLVQKLGKKSDDNEQDFIDELEAHPIPSGLELFIFVDDCHRSQSGKLNLTLKMMLHRAVFIGFTSIPLLKKDKKITLEIFGNYIHTDKVHQQGEDEFIKKLVFSA
ncbi:type I restriction endonuclease [Pedobacter immunditicola]|uniref:type I restriction endonuclease n=1 Tax=Pedobacter immunditicola TaxID=3133440 RepID=UPI0030AEEFEF